MTGSFPDTGCCCLPDVPATPIDVWNRPGLPGIAVRIGTFASFRQTLLDAIAREPALAALTTRESDDHAVSVIEMFSAIADVLTFYNERIVNERYLRTARDRDSVLRLVRLIGYQLNPGLAATAMLAFTLDDGARTRLRTGFKVMSIPGQDETAQIYETLAEIIADARLNDFAVGAPPVLANAFAAGANHGPVTRRPSPLSQGDALVLFGDGWLEEKSLDAIVAAPLGEKLYFSPAVQMTSLSHPVARLVRVNRRLRFFGATASDSYQDYDTNPATPPALRWRTLPIDPSFGATLTGYPLDARYNDLKTGAQLMIDCGPGVFPRIRTAVVTSTSETPETLGNLHDTVSRISLRQTIRGTPALAAPAGGLILAARSGAANAIVFGFGEWKLFEFAASSDPSLVLTSPNRLDLFIRDGQFLVRHISWTGGVWSAITTYAGPVTSDPAGLAVSSSEVLMFARGLDLGLWFRTILPATPGWTPLGGLLGSAPAPVVLPGGLVDVYIRGVDRALWHKLRIAGVWSDWLPLEGVLGSPPAAAAPSAAHVDVVALDDAGALIHRRWDGVAWSAWLVLGGQGQGKPAIAASGADRVEIFVRGIDGVLRHIERTGTTWSGWTALGSGLTSDPAAIVDAAGVLQVAIRDGDATLAFRSRVGAAWLPWGHGEAGLGLINDRRRARIYDIGRDDIVFADLDYPDMIDGGQVAARFDGAPPPELVKGRQILLEGGAIQHVATVTAATPAASDFGAAPDHVLIDFVPALPQPLTGARIKANIAQASHGETQPDETLGNGDATLSFQNFQLAHAPETQLPSATALTPTAALELRVGGELWKPVPSLYARLPTERVYTARQDDSGATTITTGDGRTGARLPTGAATVVARYRKGLGLAGRMRADQLAIALERPVGLRTVTNPLPSDGGADPELRDDARVNAPTTVLTFGRAVSLDDFASIATTSGLVARAEVAWVWSAAERAVHLTVAGPGGTRLSALALARLYTAFQSARDPNRQLFLANLVRVPLTIGARIVADPDLAADAVLASARAALLALFDFAAMPFGKAVHASQIYAALQGASGVVAVDLDWFQLLGFQTLTPVELAVRSVTIAPVQEHVRLYAARPTPKDPAQIDRYARAGFDGPVPPPVLAAEQAYIATPATDVVLVLVGAL